MPVCAGSRNAPQGKASTMFLQGDALNQQVFSTGTVTGLLEETRRWWTQLLLLLLKHNWAVNYSGRTQTGAANESQQRLPFCNQTFISK